jgi:Beta-propeller repeat
MRSRVTLLGPIVRSVRFSRAIASISALAIALLPAIPALAGECSSVGATGNAVSPVVLPRDGAGLLDDVGARAGGARAVKQVSVVSATNPVGTSAQRQAPLNRPALKPRMLERGPLTFVENSGQFDPQAKFTAQRGDDTIRLTNDSIVFGLARTHAETGTPAKKDPGKKNTAGIASLPGIQLPLSLDHLSFSERIAGANPALRIEPQMEQPGKYNFLLGSDRAQWRKNVKGYALVTYRDAWRGVDLRLYGQGRDLEHVFVVKPGGDPNSIRMDLSGIKELKVAADGSLAIDTAFGELSERKPIAYQTVNGKRAEVPVRVKVAGNSYAFAVGKYDTSSPLVIDPVLLYSTYLGGIHDDDGQAITTDAAGNAYVLGLTASQNFPITANAYQTIRNNLGTYTYDVFVTKISPSGVLLFSTFVGGNSNDYGFDIKVDPLGYVYFVGQTQSTDYPTTPGAFATVDNNCVEGLVTKLSPDGSSLIYSTYIGGSDKFGCGGEIGDNLVEGLALDSSGDAFIAGATGSPDFPVTPGAYETKYPVGSPPPNDIFLAGFAAELSPNGSHLLYSTLLGSAGAGNEGVTLAKSVAIDSAGNAYVAGLSNSIPTTPGAYRTVSLGDFDAFVVKLNPTGSNAKCATLLGGSGHDEGSDILLDSSNNIYLAGRTDSSDFPATPGAYATKAPGGSQVFVARLTPDCSTLDWASVVEPFQPNPGSLGQFFDLGAIGFARDPSSGDLFVASDTADQHLLTTPDAAQKSFGGGTYDGFLMELDSTASSVLYATYFGGTGDDGINAIALDSQGNVFMTGATTSSTGFPLTPDAFQTIFGGTTGQAVDQHDAFFAALGTGTIGSIYPTSGGNVGSVTLKITGSNLQTGATATLVKGGRQIKSELALLRPDGNEMNAIFELGGAAPGAYDVVVTNPDSSTLRMPAAFNVVAGGTPNVWVNISGRSAIRTGTPTNFSITYGNSGNVDAYAVNVFLSFPAGVSYTEIAKFIAGAHAPALSPPDTTGLPTTYTDSTTGITYLELMLPVITAGGSGAIPIQLTASPSVSDTFELQAFTYPVSFDSYATLQSAAAGTLQNPQTQQMSGALDAAFGVPVDAAGGGGGGGGGGACVSLNAAKAAACLQDTINLALTLAGISGTSNCIGVGVPAALGLIANAVSVGMGGPLSASQAGLTMTQVWTQVGTAIAACAGVLVPEAALALGALQALLQLPQLFADCSQIAQPCPQPPTPVKPVSSLDPNDKTGPQGALQGHWVLGNQPLNYTVSFENDAKATAPAQQVVITDQLSPTKFNLKTVQLGAMGFGNTVVTPPPGSTNYSTTVDMGAVASVADLKVNIQGSLDTATGLLKWTFSSIDASTGGPPQDPSAGFLPPNAAGVAPAGTGSVVFSVRPKHGLVNGSKVTNQASVVFDTNAPILTPIWHNAIAQPVAGALSFSPRPLNFGNRPVFGTSGAMPVEAITLSNPSGVPILVGNISTTSNFQIVNPQACQTLMNPGQSCALRIRFVPDAVTTFKGKLIIADNSTSSPQSVALEGAGVAGALSFTPDSMAFGEVKVNTTSGVKHLKMTNVTAALASVLSVVPTSAFVTSNDLCTGATLSKVNPSCTVDVAFKPTITGKVSGKLMVATDSAKAQAVELTGNGEP